MKNLIIFLAAGLLLFYLDSITQLGYAVWLFYIVLLFLFLTFADSSKYIPFVSIVYSVLIVLGYFLSPPMAFDTNIPIVNRAAAILILLLFSMIGMREKETKKLAADILDRIKDLFIALDRKFRITFANKNAMHLISAGNEIIGKDLFQIFPEADTDPIRTNFRKALDTHEPVQFQYALRRSENYLDISVYASEKGISVFAKDITKKVIAEKRLVQLLHEKEMLVREIHHRTKNNFQLVLSLLNLQINSIQDELAQKILNETRARLLSITVLYDKLFKTGDFYTVEMNTFISEIIMNMETAVNFGMMKMTNELEIETAKIGIDAAIPIGLIINELYTNSLKYAFNGSRVGSVKIQMKFLDDATLYVLYRDNGKGLPEGFKIEKSGGLGSSIVTGFIDQLEGKISHRNNNGAEFEMTVKVKRYYESPEPPPLILEPIVTSE